MTNKEILKKAITKASENGYYCELKVYWALFHCDHFSFCKSQFYSTEQNYRVVNIDENGYPGEVRRWHSIYDIIFSHEFAKAFWGKRRLEFMFLDRTDINYFWEYHLQQMVLEEEPLKYLEKFL
jgi:hypothetical protein